MHNESSLFWPERRIPYFGFLVPFSYLFALQVVHACYTKVSPSVEVEKPELVVRSESVAELLELDPKE